MLHLDHSLSAMCCMQLLSSLNLYVAHPCLHRLTSSLYSHAASIVQLLYALFAGAEPLCSYIPTLTHMLAKVHSHTCSKHDRCVHLLVGAKPLRSPTWCFNPQFRITVRKASEVVVCLGLQDPRVEGARHLTKAQRKRTAGMMVRGIGWEWWCAWACWVDVDGRGI